VCSADAESDNNTKCYTNAYNNTECHSKRYAKCDTDAYTASSHAQAATDSASSADAVR
jgi:hypothetical protein